MRAPNPMRQNEMATAGTLLKRPSAIIGDVLTDNMAIKSIKKILTLISKALLMPKIVFPNHSQNYRLG